MMMRQAKFGIGDVVRHRLFPFRGVIFDVDPVFANTEEWWLAIPEDLRPRKDQPFYRLLAENEPELDEEIDPEDLHYEAYVSEQNLLPDESGEPVSHPDVPDCFGRFLGSRYEVKDLELH